MGFPLLRTLNEHAHLTRLPHVAETPPYPNSAGRRAQGSPLVLPITLSLS